MKTSYASLMPILRSQVQGRILAMLIVNKDSEFSVTELASRAETSIPTALREIRRLEAVGLPFGCLAILMKFLSWNRFSAVRFRLLGAR